MFNKHILFVLLMTFVGFNGFSQTEKKQPGQSFANGDYLECISSCDDLLKSDANNEKANFFKGSALVKLKKYKEAKTYLATADKNKYQPQNAIRINQLRAYAGLHETEPLLDSLQILVENGFRALFVLNEEEFQYLNANDKFNKLKTKVDANANPCKYGAEYKRLDFWIGEWDVFVNDTKIGTSSITKSEGGCTLYEDYKTFSGFLGRSTNYYDPADKRYTQIWIDKFNSITIFKELAAKENYLQMSVDKGEGNLTRMTYVRDPISGHVTQTMEASTDKGENWTSNFVGVYKKKETELRNN